ncbi:MAG: hypothetical protein Q4D79_08990, partial [Propionibacteriaceae bacterium]|nr:hypothetical protein [Propionibacteriaceae bacterium]
MIDIVPQDLERVRSDFGEKAFTAMPWFLPVRQGDRESTVTAMVTATPQNEGFFTNATVVASVEVEGDAWIDVSADLEAYSWGLLTRLEENRGTA